MSWLAVFVFLQGGIQCDLTVMYCEVERKTGKTFCPPGGKQMLVFLDDLSMPIINTWGDQITNELTRQLIECNGYYFLDKDKRGDFKTIEGIQYLGAMGHPGGGKNDIPPRLKSKCPLALGSRRVTQVVNAK